MNNLIRKWIKGVITSKSLTYVFFNYLSYLLIFFNSLLIANYASVYIFGVYGFIFLFNQYIYYGNFGIGYSLGSTLAIKKDNADISSVIWANAVFFNLAASVVICLLIILIVLFYPGLFIKYSLLSSVWLLLLNALIINQNSLYTHLYRTYSSFFKINISQILPPVFIFICILVKKENVTIDNIIYSFLLGNLISLFFFIFSTPLNFQWNIKFKLLVYLVKRGVNLLIYNLSFTFILTAAATLVSIFYAVQDFGQFKFAQSISTATYMAASAFTFIFYSKMLHIFNKRIGEECYEFLVNMKKYYLNALNLTSFAFVLIAPLIAFYYEDYIPMLGIYKFLIIGKIFTNQTALYNILLVAKKQESYLSLYGFISVCCVVVLGMITIYLGLNVLYMAIPIVAGSVLYSLQVSCRASILLKRMSKLELVKDDFNYKIVLPVILILISILLNENLVLPIITFIVYLLLNMKEIKIMNEGFKRLVFDKNILEY